MYRKMQFVVMFLFVFSAAAWAQQDAHLGTWKLNVAKSKYDPGPADKSSTTKFESAGPNGVKATVDAVDGEGQQIHFEYTAKDDGKDVPVIGSAAYDMVSYRKTDSDTRVSVWKKGGTVVRMLRSVVAKDGKTRIIEGVGIDAKGRAYHNATFYDKQ